MSSIELIGRVSTFLYCKLYIQNYQDYYEWRAQASQLLAIMFSCVLISLVSLFKILLERSHGSISCLYLGTFLSLSYEAILIIHQKTFRFVCLNTYKFNIYIGKHCSILCVLCSFYSVLQSSLLHLKAPTWMSVFLLNNPASKIPRHSLVHQLQLDLYFILVL